MLVLIVLIYSGRLVAVPPGGMMSVLWPGSQPAPHKHGEVQKRGKVLEQIINSCELPSLSCQGLYIYTILVIPCYCQGWNPSQLRTNMGRSKGKGKSSTNC